MQQINFNNLVTVITLTKNRATLLPRAIKSVLNQSHKNIEYIIIDGASEDGTDQVVKQFDDRRIKYIRLGNNWSVPDSILHGVRKSSSEYITFLDDDDEYLPEKVEKQLALIRSLPSSYGFVYCWMDYYNDLTNLKYKSWHPTIRGNVFDSLIEKPAIGGTPTLFLRREAFDTTGGWHSRLKYISDWEFACRLSRVYLTDFVPEVLVHVHTHHNYARMMTRKENNEKLLDMIEFHQYFLSEFAEGFKIQPKKQATHLKTLVKLHFKLRDYKQGLKCLGDMIKCHANIRVVIKTTVRAIYIFLRNQR